MSLYAENLQNTHELQYLCAAMPPAPDRGNVTYTKNRSLCTKTRVVQQCVTPVLWMHKYAAQMDAQMVMVIGPTLACKSNPRHKEELRLGMPPLSTRRIPALPEPATRPKINDVSV